MEEKISNLLNSFAGIHCRMPSEAADCIREYFCENESDTDEDESDAGEDENDIDKPVVRMGDVQRSPTATATLTVSTDAVMTAVVPAATFDRPLICSSIPDPMHSTASSHDKFWLKEEAAVGDYSSLWLWLPKAVPH